MFKRKPFYLYDLKIELIEIKGELGTQDGKIGDYFTLSGENLSFPDNQIFSIYNLASILPLLPAMQRNVHKNDWMASDNLITGPDPNCGAIFKITRTKKTKFYKSETTKSI